MNGEEKANIVLNCVTGLMKGVFIGLFATLLIFIMFFTLKVLHIISTIGINISVVYK